MALDTTPSVIQLDEYAEHVGWAEAMLDHGSDLLDAFRNEHNDPQRKAALGTEALLALIQATAHAAVAAATRPDGMRGVAA